MDTPGAVIKTQMSFVTTIQGDKAIVESAVIGFLRGKRVGGGGGNASARGRKSWCLHKILISDTSQSGIRYKGSCEEGSLLRYSRARARHSISISILFCLRWLFPRRVEPTRRAAASRRFDPRRRSRYSPRQIVIMRIDT